MPAPLLIAASIALATEFAPSLVRWIAGDESGEIAEKVVSVARDAISADASMPPAKIMDALRSSPEALSDFIAKSHQLQLQLEQETTAQLGIVNQTLQAESTSSDPFVRRMRPFFGYVIAVTWTLQMVAITYAIVTDPGIAPVVIDAIADLTVMWSVALSVIGVYVWKRTEEKKATGDMPVASLLDAFRRKP